MATNVPMTRRLPDDRGNVVEVRRKGRDVIHSATLWQRRVVIGLLPFSTMIFWFPALSWALDRTVNMYVRNWVITILSLVSLAWGLAGMGMLLWLMLPGRASRRIASWRRAHRVCGACAYPLNGLQAAEDGRTVCPECGAAWLLPPA
jgi:hypothetical protein